MRRLFASFLSLSLLAAACTFSTPTPNPDSPTDVPPPPTVTPTSIPSPMEFPWDDRPIFQSGLVASEQHILNELSGASVYHIEFTIADNLYEITGTEEVRYTNSEDVALNEVQFRLFPNILGGEMTISNLTFDGYMAHIKQCVCLVILPACRNTHIELKLVAQRLTLIDRGAG